MDYTKIDVYGAGDNLGQLRGMLGGKHLATGVVDKWMFLSSNFCSLQA